MPISDDFTNKLLSATVDTLTNHGKKILENPDNTWAPIVLAAIAGGAAGFAGAWLYENKFNKDRLTKQDLQNFVINLQSKMLNGNPQNQGNPSITVEPVNSGDYNNG